MREALTNALCHRQLEKYNLTLSIAVYDDRVEIENPGRLPVGLTPDTIKHAHASYPYNPLIAEVLYRSSFLESWGSGVGRMVDACRAQGVPEPEYEVNGGFVRIVFKRNGPGAVQGDPEVIQSDPELVKAVYDLIHENHSISRAALAKALGISERQVRKAIDILRDKKIRRKGGDSGEWVIIG